MANSHVEKLGELEKVDVRKVWEYEARDFSTWLVKQENLALLSEQIGIEIEPISTEANCGRFRIVIFVKEAITGDMVVIENQLESTNHDHLGKVITYAARLDDKYLIWIVKDVLPEHLKVLEWLNEHINDKINCSLIKFEVWQIGDPHPAPRFEMVGIKDDWAASLKKSTTSDEPSAGQLAFSDFWEKLRTYIRAKDKVIKLQPAQLRRYLGFTMGDSIAHVVFPRCRVNCLVLDNRESLASKAV